MARCRAVGDDEQAVSTVRLGSHRSVGDQPWQAAGDRRLPGLPQYRSQQWPGVAGEADEHADIQGVTVRSPKGKWSEVRPGCCCVGCSRSR